jgi:hypothetical protein
VTIRSPTNKIKNGPKSVDSFLKVRSSKEIGKWTHLLTQLSMEPRT